MKTISKIFIRFLCVAVPIFSTTLEAANRITLKAEASVEYTRERATNPTKKIQTYQFMKGRYFGGITSDPGMKDVTFNDLVQNLAANLVNQDFYPNPVMGEGDLLIVVHYGVTDFEESYEDMWGITSLEDMGYNDTVANAGAGGTALDSSSMDAINNLSFNLGSSATTANANTSDRYFKAKLLGMEKAFTGKASIQEEYELKLAMQDERYFVILMAYDYASVKSGAPKLQWSTRYSVRTVGQSFEDALVDMNFAAGDYFGKNLKDLKKKRMDDNSHVEIGDIEVIGEEPASTNKTN